MDQENLNTLLLKAFNWDKNTYENHIETINYLIDLGAEVSVLNDNLLIVKRFLFEMTVYLIGEDQIKLDKLFERLQRCGLTLRHKVNISYVNDEIMGYNCIVNAIIKRFAERGMVESLDRRFCTWGVVDDDKTISDLIIHAAKNDSLSVVEWGLEHYSSMINFEKLLQAAIEIKNLEMVKVILSKDHEFCTEFIENYFKRGAYYDIEIARYLFSLICSETRYIRVKPIIEWGLENKQSDLIFCIFNNYNKTDNEMNDALIKMILSINSIKILSYLRGTYVFKFKSELQEYIASNIRTHPNVIEKFVEYLLDHDLVHNDSIDVISEWACETGSIDILKRVLKPLNNEVPETEKKNGEIDKVFERLMPKTNNKDQLDYEVIDYIKENGKLPDNVKIVKS